MSELDWQKLRGAVDNRLLDVIKEDFKFTNMTPVQSATIPLFIANKDVAVEVNRKKEYILICLLGCYWIRKDSCICDSNFANVA